MPWLLSLHGSCFSDFVNWEEKLILYEVGWSMEQNKATQLNAHLEQVLSQTTSVVVTARKMHGYGCRMCHPIAPVLAMHSYRSTSHLLGRCVL